MHYRNKKKVDKRALIYTIYKENEHSFIAIIYKANRLFWDDFSLSNRTLKRICP